MKRILPTTLALSLLGLAACSGGSSANATKLVPDAADFVGGVDIKGLTSSKMYTDNKSKMEEEADYKEFVEAAKGCNLDPEKFDSIVMGMAPAKESVVIVVNGAGIGKEENLKCAVDKMKEKGEGGDVTFEDKDGKRVMNIDGGEAFGYLVNENMLAVASADWATPVAELIDGKGTSAIDASLKDVYGRADTSKHLWFAGNIPSEMAGELGPAASAKSVAGSLHFQGGLEIAASAGFADADTAKSTADVAQAEFDKVKGMAGLVGIPQTVVDSVKIEAAEASINISAKATDADLEAMQKTLEEMAG